MWWKSMKQDRTLLQQRGWKEEVVLLDEEPDADIHDKIVVVPKADPGYEWVFTKGNQSIYHPIWRSGISHGHPLCRV